MEIISKEYYIFKKFENYNIEELKEELKSIKNIPSCFISQYDIRKYSVIKQMIDKFKNNNYKNPYKKPNKNYDIIY